MGVIVVTLVFAGCGLLSACKSGDKNTLEQQQDTEALNETEIDADEDKISGVWTATTEDGTDLKLTISEHKNTVYLSSNKMEYQYQKLEPEKFDATSISFTMEHKVDAFVLNLQMENGKLQGTCTYEGKENPITFDRESDTVMVGTEENAEWADTFEQLQEKIKNHSEYEADEMQYDFSVTLGEKEKYEDLIEQYGLDKALAGKEDIELMKAALIWIDELLDHDSMNIAENRNFRSLLTEAVDKNANCRGLSLILSQVLRMYGVRAEIISCNCYSDVRNDSHAVVQAYSEKLGQWILLDPTYEMILQNEDGSYVDIPTLRENIAAGKKMTYNPEANYNGEMMTEEGLSNYLSYMGKNSCYYIKQTLNYDGSDCDENNINVVLTSKNYVEPKQYETANKYHVVITNDADKFWEKDFTKAN